MPFYLRPILYTFQSAFVIIEVQLDNIISLALKNRKYAPYDEKLQSSFQKKHLEYRLLYLSCIGRNGHNGTD